MSLKKDSIHPVVVALIFFILGFSLYFNSIQGQFIWDDNNYIRNNLTIRHIANWPKLFTQTIASGSDSRFIYYRPLQELTYMLDYQISKLNPAGYHVTNILLHFLVTWFVYKFIFLLFKDQLLAFLTGLFFIIHPVQTEAVCALAGRGEPLAALFILAGVYCYLKSLDTRNIFYESATFLSFLLAFLTKENSLIMPLLLWPCHWICHKKFDWKKLLPVSFSLFIYLIFRIFLVKSKVSILSQLSGAPERVPAFFDALLNYFRILVMPFNLHFDYGYPIFQWTDLSVLAGTIFFLILCGAAFLYRQKKALISFAIIWFLLTLTPYTNVLPLFSYMAEHYLYLPSIGFCLVLAFFLTKLLRDQKTNLLGNAILIASIIYFSAITLAQNFYWINPIVFYKQTLQHNPYSAGAYNSLGAEYGRKGQVKKEIACYLKAIELNDKNELYYRNLGLAYLQIKQFEKAKINFETALGLDPQSAKAAFGLGIIHANKKELQEAKYYFEKALEINPRDSQAYYHLYWIKRHLGQGKK